MTPEMWLELEPIKHRCHAQLAAVRQNPSGDQHGVALLLHWLSRSTLEWCATSLHVVLVPWLRGLGRHFYLFMFNLCTYSFIHLESICDRHKDSLFNFYSILFYFIYY